jgi:hypothetical protein
MDAPTVLSILTVLTAASELRLTTHSRSQKFFQTVRGNHPLEKEFL